MVGLPIIMALLIAPVVRASFSRPPHEGWPLLLLSTTPQAFVIALPLAYFFAVILDRAVEPAAPRPAGNRRSLDGMRGHRARRHVSCRAGGQPGLSPDGPRAAARVRHTRRSLAPGPGEMTVHRSRATRPQRRIGRARPARRRLYSGLAVSALPLVLGIVAFGVADPRLKGGIALFSGFWVLMFYAAALRSVAGSVSTPPSAGGLALVDAVFLVGGLWMTWVRSRSFDGAPSGPRFGVPTRL